jgi:hypothetical protein
MGANLTDRMPQSKDWKDALVLELLGVENQFGWPMVALENYHPLMPDGGGIYIQYSDGTRDPPERPRPSPSDIESRWNRKAAIIDMLVAIGMLLTAAFLSEFLIRRHEGRKP